MSGFRWTIKRKLLALGGGTLLSLLLLLGLWGLWEVREKTENVEDGLTLASQQAAGQVKMLLSEVTGRLGTLAGNPAVQRLRVGQMEELFREAMAGHRDVENIAVFLPDGRLVAAAIPAPGLVSVADRPWFRHVMAISQPVASSFLTSRLTGRPIAWTAIPIREGEGPIVGVLGASFDLRGLHRLFEFLQLAGGMTVTVVDVDGRVLSQAPASEGWIGRQLPSAVHLPVERAVLRDLAWPEGGDRMAAVMPIAGTTGWRVLVGIPRASLERRLWRELRDIALPLVGLLAVAGMIGLVVARRVWRPLEALADAATRLPRGEEVAVRVESTDEVGELARAFATMAAEIKAARASLERRVSELTALTETGHLLTGTLELSEVSQRLTELARTRLRADVVRVWLWEGAAEELRLHAQAGVTRQSGEYRMRLGPSEGLVAWIMGRREPLVIEDLASDPRLQNRGWVEAEGLVAFLGVPIVLDDVPVGLLACMSRERREFSADDVALAQLFALPAAVAIRNARLYEDTRTRARELSERNAQLELLHEAARAITAEHELDRLLQRITEAAREFLGAAHAALAVFGEDGRVRTFHTAGITAEEREHIGRLPEGRGLLGHLFEHAEPLRLDDLTTHPASVGFPPGHPPMRTLLAVPIRLKERSLGALYLTEKPGGFTAGDETLLSTLSADAAVAIENARLVERLRQALDDLEATRDQLVRGETIRAMGELASEMAHHLNNTLAVIRGRVQLLLEKVEEPAVRRALEITARAAADGAELIRRVQEFSRTQPVSRPVAIDLNQLAREALEANQPRRQDELQGEILPIEARLDPGQIPPVSGDPDGLREVLGSLLRNAIEALPGEGRITIRTWASGDRVHCAVSDTGVGMSEEVRRQALEPFFTTKGPRRGGLGLSVVHGIVRRHGGQLDIESAPGRGTTVTISLPAAPVRPIAEPAATTPAATATRKILVIDDEAEIREVLAEMLAHEGHRVSQAAGGADGLALFRADRHDLVFTCARMPGMTGAQVAEAIKALSPTTPVVLMIGWSDEIANLEGKPTAVDQVISKPFDVNAVATAVARMLPDPTA